MEAVQLAQKLGDGRGRLGVVPQGVDPISHGVDLVDEDDAAIRVLLGLLEELSHSFGPHAHKELLEFRSCCLDELALGLVSEGSSQHCLAGSWRTIEEHASSDSGSEFLEFLWIVKKVNDLLELGLDELTPINVIETTVVLVNLGLIVDALDRSARQLFPN